jgi:DHA3 family macrolide efflux protein-like MFS transporter
MESQPKWKGNFYIIVAGQTVSFIGSFAVQFALMWWLAKETGSAIMVSLTGLLIYLPQGLLAPFAGVWIDRLKRKPVIIAADLFGGLAALAFSFAFFVGDPPYWTACVVLGVRSIASVFHTPAMMAVFPLLVPQEALIKANSINQFLQVGAIMLAPVLGAAMYSAWPMEIILLSDLVGALFACLTVAAVKISEIKQAETKKQHFIEEMKEGLQAYIQDKNLWTVTIFTTIAFIFLMPLQSLYPLMISSVFNGNEWHVSAVNITSAIGMMVAAVVCGVLGNKIKNKLNMALAGLLLSGANMLVCGILPHNTVGLWALVGLCSLFGAGINVYKIPYTTYLQENIPNEKQGRVMSLYTSLSLATTPLGLLIAGPFAEVFGITVYFMFAGALTVLLMTINIIISSAKYGEKGQASPK